MDLQTNPLDLVSDYFKILSDPDRLKILCSLRLRTSTVIALSRDLDIDLSEIIKQLNMMVQAKIIELKQSDGEILYEITNPHVIFMCDLVRDALDDDEANSPVA
ncbi:MAG: winged helix-turn-helix domain-containing protein [Cyanobacteria bacterium P01_D01_bin.73]